MAISAEQRKALKRFYQSLAERALEPGDPAYVEILEDSAVDPIVRLATSIEFSDSNSVQLLTGQRGNGKSTQLNRLKAELEASGCTVLLANMGEYLHTTRPVGIADFIMALMIALVETADKITGQNSLRDSYGHCLVRFINTEVRVDQLSLKLDSLGSVKLALLDNHSFKKKLQDQSSGLIGQLRADAVGLVADVLRSLRAHSQDPERKVVFIADSIEHIRGAGTLEEIQAVHHSMQELFSANANQLIFPELHLVYTVPPYLLSLAPRLGNLFGSVVVSVPSIPVRNRKGSPQAKYIQLMEALIAKREPDWQHFLSAAQLARVALASGGDIRDFFRMIQFVLTSAPGSGALPVEDAGIAEAENAVRRELLPLPENDRKWLADIHQNKEPSLQDVSNLPQLARFFDSGLVLNYPNETDWCDVHPLLQQDLG